MKRVFILTVSNYKNEKVINSIISAVGLYQNHVGGMKINTKLEQLISNQNKLNETLIKLSDHIYFNPSIDAINDVSNTINKSYSDLVAIKEYLTPIQRTFKKNILSSNIINTPIKMNSAMKENPWSVLVDIRPAHLSQQHLNPDMIPVVFNFEELSYIGWQMKGTLPLLFNIELKENIWIPKESNLKPLYSTSNNYSSILKNDLFDVFMEKVKIYGFKRWSTKRHWSLYSKSYPNIRFTIWKSLIRLEERNENHKLGNWVKKRPYLKIYETYDTKKKIVELISLLEVPNEFIKHIKDKQFTNR